MLFLIVLSCFLLPLPPDGCLADNRKGLKEVKRRQFGIRLKQRELLSIFNTIPLNVLWFVVEETICSERSNQVHQEIVDRPVS